MLSKGISCCFKSFADRDVSIMIFNIRTSFGAIGWSMLLYLCDLHINRSPLRMADARVPR